VINVPSQPGSPTAPAVRRQISLPLTKAIELAYKSIRMRLSRSLLVTSGVVLALAFLMSIRTTEALNNGMRAWIANPTGLSGLNDEMASLTSQMKDLKDHRWLDLAKRRKAIEDELQGPQTLRALMEQRGVPTNADDVQADRTQTRWLLVLALLVAFVGILNAMLMSVTERFREIGTMKCLGALDGFIIKLFLIESLFQGIVGTVVGIAVGLALSLAGAAANYGSFAWKNLNTADIGSSIIFCLIVGIGLTISGAVYPAWQAARMQPVDAMRAEV
jgi:putative ABC transport system permease protein